MRLIQHDQDKRIFYYITEGEESHLMYSVLSGGVLAYNHTYVPPALRGKGIAADLVKTALDFAREEGLKVKPNCSYVRLYMRRHPEYHDLTAE